MFIDVDGRCDLAQFIPSPNCDPRPDATSPELLVIHYISLPPDQFGGAGVVELFQNRLDPLAHPFYAEIAHLCVSAHFFIRRDGELIQFVPTTERAWHAGQSRWRDRERCNDFSIGIELEGSGNVPFTEAQYQCLAALGIALKQRHPTLRELTGHEHIAPDRKQDPGPYFDWSRACAEGDWQVWPASVLVRAD